MSNDSASTSQDEAREEYRRVLAQVETEVAEGLITREQAAGVMRRAREEYERATEQQQ
jgi:hypothetical protein